VEKCLIGLLLLYTSQNLLGTIFRVTFTVFYRRIWNIVGKYSILCCDTMTISKLVCPPPRLSRVQGGMELGRLLLRGTEGQDKVRSSMGLLMLPVQWK
jgi:hypothetical protein